MSRTNPQYGFGLSSADYQHQRRRNAEAAGKCSTCSTRRPSDADLKTCDACLRSARDVKARRRERIAGVRL